MHTLKYGDVITQGHGKAMFIAYDWEYGGSKAGRIRPGQYVLIVSAPTHLFSLNYGGVYCVNWLDLQGNEPLGFRIEDP